MVLELYGIMSERRLHRKVSVVPKGWSSGLRDPRPTTSDFAPALPPPCLESDSSLHGTRATFNHHPMRAPPPPPPPARRGRAPPPGLLRRGRLDHTRILGDTVEEIAAEKAGIFKAGVPALIGDGCAALEVLRVRCNPNPIPNPSPNPNGVGCSE